MLKTETKPTVKNSIGVDIVICCASCQYKEFKDDKERVCKITGTVTYPSENCTNWRMSEKLQNVGKGGGRVKKKAWFKFVAENGNSEFAIKQFEKQYGSRFIDGR